MDSKVDKNSISSALAFSSLIHEGEKRRDGVTPYLSHPLIVAGLVLRYGGTEEQAIAGILHDTISHSKVTQSSIRDQFGQGVCNLVYAFEDPIQSSSWEELRKAYIHKLKSLSSDAILVVGCEELHELTDLLEALRQTPPKDVWKRYPAVPMNLCWYFKEILVILNSSLMNSKPSSSAAKSLVSEFARHLKVLQEMVFESA